MKYQRTVQKKICFFHNRKAGGTTIKDFFGASAEVLTDGILDDRWEDSVEMASQRLPTVVTIRNPWDRFVSAWKYCRSTKWRSIIDVCKYPPMERDFSGVFRWNVSMAFRFGCMVNCLSSTFPFKRRRDGHDFRHLSRQQTDLFLTSSGEMAVDHIIYLEDLENELQALSNRYGLDWKPVERKNAASRPLDYRTIINREAEELIRELWPTDVQYLGYRFEDGPGKPPGFGERLLGRLDD